MFDGSNPYFSLLYLREKNTLPNGTVSKTQIPPEADELKLVSKILSSLILSSLSLASVLPPASLERSGGVTEKDAF